MSDDRDATDVHEAHSRSAPELASGTLLGPYRIESRLGAGGMGVVYRATDTRLSRPVAVKFVSNDRFDATARERFRREALLASALNHPNILTVYDVGERDGREYLVTELVEGGTLEDWMRVHERRDWRSAIELLSGVADGLAEAHAADILHRDIKPGNVLVSRTGHAKLADFGLAKRADGTAHGATRYTAAGIALGTVAYMSPEQATGQPLDARSDVFSFGMLLYELLAGHSPFTGRTDLEVMRAILDAAPEPLPRDIPDPLRAVVEKMLEKNPAERYQSMREVAVDLRRVLRKSASEPAVAQRSPAWAGGRGLLWSAVALAAIAVAAVAVWLAAPGHRQQAPRIAVLPFVDLNHESSNRLLVDGLHEEILTALSDRAGDAVEVIPRTTMMLYADGSKPLSAVATELHATHVLESTVRRDGEEVRLSLRLIDARSDRPVWDRVYTRSTQVSALQLQSEVAGDVAVQLSAKLGAVVRAASKLSTDPDAAEAFVRATLLQGTLSGASREDRWREVENLFTRAIERDPEFVRAYIERANVRLVLFTEGYEPSTSQVDLVRADLAAAKRLAPRDPLVLAGDADFALFEGDRPRANELTAAAESAGLSGPQLSALKAAVNNSVEEQIEAVSLLAERDPGNAALAIQQWFGLASVRRPSQALRVLERGRALLPNSGLWPALRANTIFSFTGDLGPLAPFTDAAAVLNVPPDSEFDPDDSFRITFERMILRGDYEAARKLHDAFGRESIRVVVMNYFRAPGIGRQPTADYRGWADLLLGDLDAARDDGRRVLAAVAGTEETRWNAWFLAALKADGQLFIGQSDEAASTAAAMLERVGNDDVARRVIAEVLAARVLAWAGRHDAAVDLLTRLATETPGLAPADIARQPYYATPLHDDARFAALTKRLEAEMSATSLD